MKTILSLNAAQHQITHIPDRVSPEQSSTVLADMVQLFGGGVIESAYEGLRVTTMAMTTDHFVSGRYEHADDIAEVRIWQMDPPEQRRKWAAIQLYNLRSGGRLQEMHLVAADGDGVELAQRAAPIDFQFQTDIGSDTYYSLCAVLDQLTSEIFTDDEGHRAVAGIVGATDIGAFQEAWVLGWMKGGPLDGARFLLDQAETYYRP